MLLNRKPVRRLPIFQSETGLFFRKCCLSLVPGQKQWQVIDVKGVLGQTRKPVTEHGMSSAPLPKRPAVQILGKERAPQVDDAASAIATQLEGDTVHDISGMSLNNYLNRHETFVTKKNRRVTPFFIAFHLV